MLKTNRIQDILLKHTYTRARANAHTHTWPKLFSEIRSLKLLFKVVNLHIAFTFHTLQIRLKGLLKMFFLIFQPTLHHNLNLNFIQFHKISIFNYLNFKVNFRIRYRFVSQVIPKPDAVQALIFDLYITNRYFFTDECLILQLLY